jgi:2-polyprenyl-6-methoxyphenol hydroxylase-like FAD-dependent oxidoreductase
MLKKHQFLVSLSKRSTSSSTKPYDIIVNGGGVVGSLFAADVLHKSKGSLKIAIVESKQPKKLIDINNLSTPDVRVYALSAYSIQALKEIGAWKYIEPRSQPYTKMQIWEENGPSFLKFDSKEMNEDELGRICEDSCIQTAIYQSIEDNGHKIDLFLNYELNNIIRSKTNNDSSNNFVNLVSVTLKNSKTCEINEYNARFIIFFTHFYYFYRCDFVLKH